MLGNSAYTSVFGAIFLSYNCYYEKTGSEVKNITDEIPFDIPDTWCWVRHNELFEVSGGSQPPKVKFSDTQKNGYVRLYQIRDYGTNPQPIYIPCNTANKITNKGDILLARYGASLGKVFWAEEGAYNVAMAKVIPLFDISKISKEYLFLYYKSSLYQDTIMGHSRSAQAGFNKEDLSKMFFVIPPLEEQKRIVNIIKDFEPLIAEYDKLEQQATKLDGEIYDKLKKSILQYAIQGKLVPQDSNDEAAAVLLERIRAEKKAQLGKKYVESYIYKGDDNCYYEHINGKDVDITEEIQYDLPNNWCFTHFSSLMHINGGYAFKSENYIGKENGVRVLRISDFNEKGFNQKRPVYHKYTPELKPFELEVNDIIMCMTGGTVGKSYFVSELPEPMLVNQRVADIKINDILNKKYCYHFILSPYIQRIIDESKNSTNDNISVALINSFIIPVPPLAEQKRIVEKIDGIFAKL